MCGSIGHGKKDGKHLASNLRVGGEWKEEEEERGKKYKLISIPSKVLQ